MSSLNLKILLEKSVSNSSFLTDDESVNVRLIEMRNELSNAIKRFEFNWLRNEHYDIVIARILTLYEFNNRIISSRTIERIALRHLPKHVHNTDYAFEHKFNTITVLQFQQVAWKYLFNDIEILKYIFGSIYSSYQQFDMKFNFYSKCKFFEESTLVTSLISSINFHFGEIFDRMNEFPNEWLLNINPFEKEIFSRETCVLKLMKLLRKNIISISSFLKSNAAEYKRCIDIIAQKRNEEIQFVKSQLSESEISTICSVSTSLLSDVVS